MCVFVRGWVVKGCVFCLYIVDTVHVPSRIVLVRDHARFASRVCQAFATVPRGTDSEGYAFLAGYDGHQALPKHRANFASYPEIDERFQDVCACQAAIIASTTPGDATLATMDCACRLCGEIYAQTVKTKGCRQ